jgi:L-asparaginase II
MPKYPRIVANLHGRARAGKVAAANPSNKDTSMPTPVLLVEVTRGAMVESRHVGSAIALDARGGTVHAWGDVEAPIYARSAIKPVQAIPLVETGAADAFSVGPRELALACASHGGEPDHTVPVADWLARIGLGERDLECGAQVPSHEPSAHAAVRSGQAFTQIHSNCSGKHSGFLTGARHHREPTRGYIASDHPSQRRWIQVLSEMSGVDLDRAPAGIDGCGIPQLGISLRGLALAFARMANPSGLHADRQTAIARIRRAVAANPLMVAGHGRFCTEVMEVLGERALVKTGAGGVFCAALPTLGLGLALKIADGAGRAAEVACAAILSKLGAIDDAARSRLKGRLIVPILNRAGRHVGEIRPARGWID